MNIFVNPGYKFIFILFYVFKKGIEKSKRIILQKVHQSLSMIKIVNFQFKNIEINFKKKELIVEKNV